MVFTKWTKASFFLVTISMIYIILVKCMQKISNKNSLLKLLYVGTVLIKTLFRLF